jgi:Zn-dependent protease with chaperone function
MGVRLRRVYIVPSGKYNRFAEFFSTHPPLSRRVEAIARSHQLTAERLSNLGRHIY